MVAAAKGNLEVASLLLSHGADAAVKAGDSAAADWAARFGYEEVAQFLNEHVAVRAKLSSAHLPHPLPQGKWGQAYQP